MPRHAGLVLLFIAGFLGFFSDLLTAQSPQVILNRHDPTNNQGRDHSLVDSSGTTSQAAKKAQSLKAPIGTVQVRTTLNVRSSPWGKVVGRLHGGEKIQIIGRNGDWYKISYHGKTAYVHSTYVSASGQPIQPTPGQGRFGAPPCSPMPTRTSSEYGPRSLYGRSFHYGIDLPIPTGTRLNALGDGKVIAISYETAGGRYIQIKYDNGLISTFCHLKNTSVKVGQRVAMGQEVARSDNTGQSTGPHLHLGIKRNGQRINPRSVDGLPLPPRK